MSMVMMKQRPVNELRGRDGYNNQCEVRWPARARGSRDVKTSINLAPQRLRVLVVDDHRDSADTMSMLVKVWGHDVKRAYDGAAGLVLAGTYRPDVLLLDIMMPKICGIDLAPQIRRQADFNDCLMIAVTGRTDATTRRQCEEAGIDLFLIKPVNLANLKTLLALESEYRLRPRPGTRPVAVPPVTVMQRKGLSLSTHARLSCAVLQDTIAS